MAVNLEAMDWSIAQKEMDIKNNRFYESIMSIGNGYMGTRGNYEEDFSGDSLQGTYIAGVYYPDKTRVGWWKNGYPEYFAKVLNSADFFGIHILANERVLDTAKWKVSDFNRELNMKNGVLKRSLNAEDGNIKIRIESEKFISASCKEAALLSYSVIALDDDVHIKVAPYINGDIRNEDSNYDEVFWEEVETFERSGLCFVSMKTKKTDFYVTASMANRFYINGELFKGDLTINSSSKYIEEVGEFDLKKGDRLTVFKYIAVTNSRYVSIEKLADRASEILMDSCKKGYEVMKKEHSDKWKLNWKESDITIEGDVRAQQAIRYNIFQLNQTYTGEDPLLNIGPKGFTGEKYGGSTYWDTEAYCIPFYLSTHEKNIARNLLIYRYKHLEKAKLNAQKLGVKGAMYPMVTMNGEECHNEWEITFEEIHRNAAIAYAVMNYVRYTGDESYLAEYGFEVLAEICRFWASRVIYNLLKDSYMILGVTGPNEYENNVNNNWYTNRMAEWCFEYALKVKDILKEKYSDSYKRIEERLGLTEEEYLKWHDIAGKMYLPYVEELDIFEQNDGYMDKEQLLVKDIPAIDLPINQNWSWDRILRSPFIKQADVLQGLFFLEDKYDTETIRRNFDYYEPRTVHESSLSPCIHSIIAGKLGYRNKAYELYLRTARLDLDNYNNDTFDGLHITSMAGTWMSIIYGFGGMRITEEGISFDPFLPDEWKSYSFKIRYRDNLLKIIMKEELLTIEIEAGSELGIIVKGKRYTVSSYKRLEVAIK